MPKVKRFDQRAVALVELRGTQTECEMFEGALADRGWPVLEKRGGTASVVTVQRFWYTIEARFPGSSINAVRGARERIEVISDELQLDLNVEVADRLVRDPVDRPQWYAYDRPEVHPHTVQLPRRARWMERWNTWRAETLGLRDTGRLITATSPSAAQNLASRPLPGARPQPRRVAARRSGGATQQVPVGVGTRRRSQKQLSWLFVLVAIWCWAGARIADTWRGGFGSWCGFGLLALLLVPAAVAVIRGGFPQASEAKALAGAGILGAVGVGLGVNMVRTQPEAGDASHVITYLMAGFVVFNGIRLLVRQWSWRAVAPWLIPTILPIVLGLVPSVGFGLHAFYLDAFDLNVEDVDVPHLWQFVASVKFTAVMNLWLVALAGLGYMLHLHWLVRERWVGYAFLLVLSAVLLLEGAWGLGLEPAGAAGRDAVATAKSGRTPVPYFGIAPEWVCAHPIGKAEAIPVDGGEFVPTRPYLKVGDAGGTVVLWDARKEQGLKVPMSKLRIVPAEERPGSCG
ncbi:hypothetical protein OG609_31340 [Streptomyces sp. NBC_01224]|uniref:hypothetical protein n=1 Tax=Streptomyces sp. NBC_01224 TaxID=2903783 RepID=UPI002E0FA1D7|nr:hypothetical protein OG609_31340 [Streptomyces sp. NBC_01224]